MLVASQKQLKNSVNATQVIERCKFVVKQKF